MVNDRVDPLRLLQETKCLRPSFIRRLGFSMETEVRVEGRPCLYEEDHLDFLLTHRGRRVWYRSAYFTSSCGFLTLNWLT